LYLAAQMSGFSQTTRRRLLQPSGSLVDSSDLVQDLIVCNQHFGLSERR
jgi:hypothetical protein